MALALPSLASVRRPTGSSLMRLGHGPVRLAPQLHPQLHPRPAASRVRRPPSMGSGGLGLALLTVCSLQLAALLMAPEGAADQAAICQRHNGEAACRVW